MNSITIKDIARLCGVSVSTVSRAMNGHPDINDETRAMIMNTIRENNYIPNNNARNLKRVESKTIAVLIKGITNPFFQDMIKVFEYEIKWERYQFLLHQVDDEVNEVEVALELEKEKRLCGIIFLGGAFYQSSDKMKQIRAPYVICASEVYDRMEEDEYSSVSIDDVKESCRMVEYLCKKGHRQIAMISARPEDAGIGRMRLAGYRQALQKNGIEFREELVGYPDRKVDAFSIESGYQAVKKLLDFGRKFTAVFAISDYVAFGVCKALRDSGIRVPEDCSVAAFDGISLAEYFNPTLTTMRQPYEKIAKATIAQLFNLIYERSGHQHEIFEGTIIEGESVKEMKDGAV